MLGCEAEKERGKRNILGRTKKFDCFALFHCSDPILLIKIKNVLWHVMIARCERVKNLGGKSFITGLFH